MLWLIHSTTDPRIIRNGQRNSINCNTECNTLSNYTHTHTHITFVQLYLGIALVLVVIITGVFSYYQVMYHK